MRRLALSVAPMLVPLPLVAAPASAANTAFAMALLRLDVLTASSPALDREDTTFRVQS